MLRRTVCRFTIPQKPITFNISMNMLNWGFVWTPGEFDNCGIQQPKIMPQPNINVTTDLNDNEKEEYLEKYQQQYNLYLEDHFLRTINYKDFGKIAFMSILMLSLFWLLLFGGTLFFDFAWIFTANSLTGAKDGPLFPIITTVLGIISCVAIPVHMCMLFARLTRLFIKKIKMNP